MRLELDRLDLKEEHRKVSCRKIKLEHFDERSQKAMSDVQLSTSSTGVTTTQYIPRNS